MDIYVAAYGNNYSDSEPFYTVGAYRTPEDAKDACEEDAARSLDLIDPQAIKWHSDADYTSGPGASWWTDATPYGYRINHVRLDEQPA